MIHDHLRIQPGQEALTPEQEAEVQRFVQERIETQLSTEPVDEPETEVLLRQAYATAGLTAPSLIRWVEGPLPLVGLGLQEEDSVVMSGEWSSVRDHGWTCVGTKVQNKVRTSVGEQVQERVWGGVGASVWAYVLECVLASVPDTLEMDTLASVKAYAAASNLAFYRFFDEYVAPNALRALAHFNERVSGYWLGQEVACLVRRPRVLARDAEGRLHSETGKCIDYHDGWGIYAWHGVRVPEQVICAPETLTREDFLRAENVEVRRVIQERMGERFVSELGGVVLDRGPRGTLYQVNLPEDDPERVARYVQVQDASTERRYFLRVPPTIQTAAEAVAWTFQAGADDYRPTQET